MRRVAVHFCPADQNAPAYAASTARPRSASAITIIGLWPPSSSWTRLPVLRRLVAHAVAGRDGAGEGDRADARIAHERGADRRPAAGEDVQHAGGQLRLGERLCDMQAGARRLVGELQHDRVPVDQRRRELPDRDRDREVPRGDQRDDAERAPPRRDLRAGGGLLEVLADGPERLARGIAQDLRGTRGLAARLAQRLAHLGRHVARDFLAPSLERGGGGVQISPARPRAASSPSRRRPRGGCDRGARIVLARRRELADLLRRAHRIRLRVGLAGRGRDPGATDVVQARGAGGASRMSLTSAPYRSPTD